MHMSYLLILVVTVAIGAFATWYVNHQIKKYSHVPNSSHMTGYQVAVGMLNYYGIEGVQVYRGGSDQNFFNPKDNSVTLSYDVFDGSSITATATACPVVEFATNTWFILLLVGIFLNMAGLVTLAIVFYAFAVLFQIVTLPVEFNASRRALSYMAETGIPGGEQAGAWNVLRACAFTYVAAALVSILQLLYYLSAFNNEN